MPDGTKAAAGSTKPPEIKLEDVVEAFSEEIRRLHGRISDLERRLRRFDNIFETAFRQEAEERLGLKKDHGAQENCASLSRLGQIERQLKNRPS